MRRRDFLKAVGATAAAWTTGLGASKLFGQGGTEKRPNFVFVLVDDLGWTDLGCYGSTFYETPNANRLAREGMRFTNAYAACPVCSPTRASIMTGKYPARLHMTDYFGARTRHRSEALDTEQASAARAVSRPASTRRNDVARDVQARRVRDVLRGQVAPGPGGILAEDQGFDVNKGGIERGGPYGGKKYFSPYGNPRLSDGPDGEHLPDRLATETCKFIEGHREGPFLAYLSFYSVHVPLMSRADLKAKYEAKAKTVEHEGPDWGEEGDRKVRLVQDHAVYGGMVEAMDQAVGKVLDTLDRLKLTENTVVFFMSDNGGLSTSEGHPTSNLPLRAGKGWLYEGGIREPMIVRWPGRIDAGSVCDEPVISTDFYPTMLEMAGLPAVPQQHLDGQSMVPLLRGQGSTKDRAFYWHYPHYGNQGGSPGGAVRLGDYKLIEFYEDHHIELYNLRDDLGEQHDLSAANPEKAAQLRRMLHEWRDSIGAAMPTPNPNHKT